MAADVTPLVRAVARLEEGWARYQASPDDEFLRDGLIQRFEFVYELAHRTVRRVLREESADPDAFDGMPFAELIRRAGEAGLVDGGWPAWRGYRELRAKTSHTYEAAVADEVVAALPGFLDEVRGLRDHLVARGTP